MREVRVVTEKPTLSKRQLRNRGIVIISEDTNEYIIDYSYNKRGTQGRDGTLIQGGRVQKIHKKVKEIDGNDSTVLEDKLFIDLAGKNIIKHRWLGEPKER